MRVLAAVLAARAAALKPARAALKPAHDVVVVGGGISGLATALELRRRGRSVTVLSRDLAQAATLAAGGMLAPQAERLEPGPLLDLCVNARSAWPAWLEGLDAPRPALNAVGGFVSPCFAGQERTIQSWRPPPEAGPAEWLDGGALRAMEPALGDCVGGWWYPLEAWVDPVEAHACLQRTCEAAGVEIRTGVDVVGLDLTLDGACGAVRLADESSITATDVCVAAGAWLRGLLPVPVDAQKGQMVALKPPPSGDRSGAPSRVVYGAACYLIPRGDRVVVGATVEDSATTHCDVRGVASLLNEAVRACPGLGDWVLDEAWAGLRPTTVDGAPVLGRTRWRNLWVCGGYWRNGILLAPEAARLLADAMGGQLSSNDARLLDACRWDRFFAPVSPESSRFLAGHGGLAAPEPAAAAAPAPPAPAATPADLDRAGYDAIKAKPAAAGDDARAANRALLSGADAPTDFPRADPDEDVRDLVLSLREERPDGSLGDELVGGPLPGDLAGPSTKADAIDALLPLPPVSAAADKGAHAADALYAKIAANKKA